MRVAVNHRYYELNNGVKYYYIELSKFREQNPDMTLPVNQWLSFIDMEKGELLEMAKKENKKVKKAFENYEVLTGDEEVKRLEEIRLMSMLEEKAALEYARKKGAKEGLKQGHEEGLKQGHEEGLKQGRKKEKIETAKKLLKLKMMTSQISEITGLNKQEIEKIKNEEAENKK